MQSETCKSNLNLQGLEIITDPNLPTFVLSIVHTELQTQRSLYLKIQACTDTGSLLCRPYTGLHFGREQSYTRLCQSHTWHLTVKSEGVSSSCNMSHENQSLSLIYWWVIYLWTRACRCTHILLQPPHMFPCSDTDARSTHGKPVGRADETMISSPLKYVNLRWLS